MNPAAAWAAKVDKAAARVATRRLVHVPYQWDVLSLWWVAKCPKCLSTCGVAAYPEGCPPSAPALHRCPCTCEQDPYTCPVGRRLVTAIHDRKGNQHVRTA